MMTSEELRVVVVVYTTAIVPIIILFNLYLKNQLSQSILKIYLSSFLICALGWELWFTYGPVSYTHLTLPTTPYV